MGMLHLYPNKVLVKLKFCMSEAAYHIFLINTAADELSVHCISITILLLIFQDMF